MEIVFMFKMKIMFMFLSSSPIFPPYPTICILIINEFGVSFTV
jgi:hypothetical protein